MDTVTEKQLDIIAERAATNTVAKMREFHEDDLKVLRERMDIGFESVDRRFDNVEERFDKVEERFDTLELRFETMEGKFIVLEQRFNIMEQRFERVENALGTLLEEFKQHQEKQRELEAQIVLLTKRVQELEMQLARV